MIKNDEFIRMFNKTFSDAFKEGFKFNGKGFKFENSDFDIDPDILNAIMNIKTPKEFEDFDYDKMNKEIERISESLANTFLDGLKQEAKKAKENETTKISINDTEPERKETEKEDEMPKIKLSDVKSSYNKENEPIVKKYTPSTAKANLFDFSKSFDDYQKKAKNGLDEERKEIEKKELEDYIDIGSETFVLFDIRKEYFDMSERYEKAYINVQSIDSIKSIDSGQRTKIVTLCGRDYTIDLPIQEVIKKLKDC